MTASNHTSSAPGRKLRVLVVLEPSGWTQDHIAGGLRAMGHEVLPFHQGGHVAKFYGGDERTLRRRRNDELVQTAREHLRNGGLDLIFCYVYDDFLEPETARALSRLNVAMVNFNVDMANQWYRQIRTAKYFTRMLCAQRANMDNLARYGARVFYFPMASNPRALAPAGARPENRPASMDVSFVGTPTPFRSRALRALVESGIQLSIYGKYWQENRVALPERTIEKTINDAWYYGLPRLRSEGVSGVATLLRERFGPSGRDERSASLPRSCLRGFAADADLSHIFSASRINLGFTRMVGDDTARNGFCQVKLRDFEVPLAGGFYLVEKAPDHEALFELGKEIETWTTFEELVEKTRYFLDHETERQAIAVAGQRRALRDHTWRARFEMLFRELGIQH
jgi:spore maturation protein CgeB